MDTAIVDNLFSVGFNNEFIDSLTAKYIGETVDKNSVDELKDIVKAFEYYHKYQEEKKKQEEEEKKQEFIKKETEKTLHLYDEMWKEIPTMSISSLSMHMNIEINGKKIKCLLDTGAMSNIISTKLVKELKLESFVDYSNTREYVGVGTNKSVGFIPYIVVKLDDITECPICVTVMDNNTSNEFILGLAFMRWYRVILDISKNKMTLENKDIKIIMDERDYK